MGKSECQIGDCDRSVYARGWCRRHYQQAWARGEHQTSPRTLVPRGASLEQRLRHIGWTETASGCWEWNGSLNSHGYGQLADGSGIPTQAHRAAYEVFHGGSPAGFDVCHKCDNRRCMNPAHLFLGTREDNLGDMSRKGRNPTGEYRSDHKLTGHDVSAIRSRYAAGGVSQKSLAVEYGVSQQLVSSIVRGQRRVKASRSGA